MKKTNERTVTVKELREELDMHDDELIVYVGVGDDENPMHELVETRIFINEGVDGLTDRVLLLYDNG